MKTGVREMVVPTTARYHDLEDSRARTGVVTMSSEEMRIDLEVFVNQGLREGWRGWPRHESRDSQRAIGTNRTCRTVPGPGCSDRSYKSYPSYMSN
jgi:hypothetical protein